MGLAAFGVIGGTAARLFGLPGPQRPTRWHRRPPSPRSAAARSSTSPPCCATRSGGPSRPASSASWRRAPAWCCATCSPIPRSPRCPRARRRALRRIVPVLVRLRVPLVVAQAIASPAAARRRVARLGARAAGVPAVRAGRHRRPSGWIARPRRSRRPCRCSPAAHRPSRPASSCSAVARRLAGTDLDDVTMDAVLRALPHNVTTEMDLELWALAQRVRADPASAAVLRRRRRRHRRSPPGSTPATLPAVLQDGLAAFLRRYGHRAVAEIDLGMPRWSDEPEHVLGVARQLPAARTRTGPDAAPDARFAAGERAAERGASRTSSPGSGGAPGGARGPSGSRSAGCAQLVGLRETPKYHLVRLIALARAELARRRRRAGRAAACSTRPTTSSSSTCRDVARRARRRRPAGTRRRAPARSTRGSCAAGTCRGSCSPTAPSPRRSPGAGAPDDGALVGTPASAGTVTGAGPRRPRPGRGAAGARRDPRRAVHRPRLDPAVPHRGRRW